VKIVLTGAAGFIGSHLAARYARDGHSVVGIDNFITGTIDNLAEARASSRFEFVEYDVSKDWSAIADRIRGADLVLHFASPASPVDYGANPIETMLVNGIGTRNALEFAASSGARFLFASTSETYGDPLVHPQSEAYWGNVNPIGVRSCYDESKRYGEALTMAYARTKGADIRLIRIFNTYGPRMRRNDGRVVPNFVTQALEGKPLTIYGDGSQTRSFCYVDDLIEGIVRCAGSEAVKGLVVNLGNPAEHTIRRFAELVCRIVGVPLNFVECPMPPDDPTRRCPDISRAKSLLDWQPQVDVEDGLERTIAYFGKMAEQAL
jgi:nucleoside-diphosphate-sugar epimerase